MLAKDRRNEILKTLRTNGGMIKMTEIISQYGVSHETARRDIEALQDKVNDYTSLTKEERAQLQKHLDALKKESQELQKEAESLDKTE